MYPPSSTLSRACSPALPSERKTETVALLIPGEVHHDVGGECDSCDKENSRLPHPQSTGGGLVFIKSFKTGSTTLATYIAQVRLTQLRILQPQKQGPAFHALLRTYSCCACADMVCAGVVLFQTFDVVRIRCFRQCRMFCVPSAFTVFSCIPAYRCEYYGSSVAQTICLQVRAPVMVSWPTGIGFGCDLTALRPL